MRRLVLLLAMLAFGAAVYLGLGLTRSKNAQAASRPDTTRGVSLPGTLYLAQAGQLYSYTGGKFTQLHPGPGQWLQPALVPGGSQMVAVNRGAEWSDLVLLGLDGRMVRSLTSNQRSARDINLNHWVFYPRPTPDGKVVYSYDSPKPVDFQVDLALWQLALDRGQSTAIRRTNPYPYTGGDVFPNPLTGGGLIYSKYKSDVSGMILSQVWLQLGLQTAGKELTQPEQDCTQPAVSPDGTRVAMVCTGGRQQGELQVAGFDGQQLGAPVTLASGQVAVPAWSPDGRSVAYLAPASSQGHFQLWVVDAGKTQGDKTGAPRQVSENLDLDATSPPAWR